MEFTEEELEVIRKAGEYAMLLEVYSTGPGYIREERLEGLKKEIEGARRAYMELEEIESRVKGGGDHIKRHIVEGKLRYLKLQIKLAEKILESCKDEKSDKGYSLLS